MKDETKDETTVPPIPRSATPRATIRRPAQTPPFWERAAKAAETAGAAGASPVVASLAGPASDGPASTEPSADSGVTSAERSGDPATDVAAPAPPPDRLTTVQARLTEAVAARRQEISQLETVLRASRDGDPARISRQVEQALLALPPVPAAGSLLRELQLTLDEERTARRDSLARTLKDACAREGIGFRVVARDPQVVLRLPPLAVRLDKDRAYADLLFAQERLETVPADAASILAGWRRAVATLDGDAPWDPSAFHHQLWRAWRYALVDEERETRPDWVEINAVHALLELFLARDRRAPYPRWRLAWDIHRLRRDRRLFDRGWRLVVGTATGSSTKDKRRVLWLEDGDGNGQFHLTLKFVRQERLGAEADAVSASPAEDASSSDSAPADADSSDPPASDPPASDAAETDNDR